MRALCSRRGPWLLGSLVAGSLVAGSVLTVWLVGISAMGGAAMVFAEESKAGQANSVLDRSMKSLAGQEVDLQKKYAGKVVLVVNTASECGLTPQYTQLQALYEKYADKGLVILGFPCNQFGKQEPGTAQQISEFCTKNYGVTFDMFDKVEVNGPEACELYQELTAIDLEPKGSGKVSWNFEKFLLDRQGKPVARFEPRTSPDDPQVIAAIEKLLAAK